MECLISEVQISRNRDCDNLMQGSKDNQFKKDKRQEQGVRIQIDTQLAPPNLRGDDIKT